ncbi:MAG: 5-(carboxyamino)imidazole ribonucleotide synthase [Proteobacteria bacterium]|nr:5-(carboxyamino)imidazole ribonucleotide synthase [Pseudomonadota bacterium]
MRVQPGRTIGILGGGQLGRMLAQAAATLGYKTLIFCPEERSPASLVADDTIVAPYKSEEALRDFASRCDVVTYEFENIPVRTAAFLSNDTPGRPRPPAVQDVVVRPSTHALKTAQNRLAEKTFLNRIRAPTTPFVAIQMLDDLLAEAPLMGFPCVLKTQRGGYDGKGQFLLRSREDIGPAHRDLMGQPAILEGFVEFSRELSIIVARGTSGAIAFYPLVENDHKDHILSTTTAPAPNVPDHLATRAQDIARKIAEGLDYVGVLAVELFETVDGGLLVNEIAPRVHNSGHWTIEGAKTSQFENHIRAICGLPLGPVDPVKPSIMTNLIGEDVNDLSRWEGNPNATIHLYGKREARPGRKMGHVTELV